MEGTNGKLQAFGFCEFVEPQYTLRCIRLLNGYEIADKKLLVKVDQKTRELLADYLKKNRPNQNTKNAKKAAALRNIRGALIRPPEDGEDEEEDSKNLILNETTDSKKDLEKKTASSFTPQQLDENPLPERALAQAEVSPVHDAHASPELRQPFHVLPVRRTVYLPWGAW